MTDSPAGNVATIFPLLAATLLATAPEHVSSPLDVYPISAGLSGAMASVFWTKTKKDPNTPRAQMILSFVTGLCCVLFAAPFVLTAVLPAPALETRVFSYFISGLIGSQVIDILMENQRKLAERAVSRTALRNWLVDPTPPPPPQLMAKPTPLLTDDTGDYLPLTKAHPPTSQQGPPK